MNTVELIRQRLAALAPQHLEIADDSALHAGHAGAGAGGHYRLTIVCERFAGLSTVARHRLVYDTLGELMRSEIHALSITAATPDEFF
ncbi:BolA family protein [Thiobacter aerophilum]|uniref:BolA family protein n=1 Tax=Thiobacter aerophilum TaxID=3121275 RepID=A0ABV0EAU8_9BURK